MKSRPLADAGTLASRPRQPGSDEPLPEPVPGQDDPNPMPTEPHRRSTEEEPSVPQTLALSDISDDR